MLNYQAVIKSDTATSLLNVSISEYNNKITLKNCPISVPEVGQFCYGICQPYSSLSNVRFIPKKNIISLVCRHLTKHPLQCLISPRRTLSAAFKGVRSIIIPPRPKNAVERK